MILKSFVLLMTVTSTWCLLDVHQKCIATFKEDFSNDFLIGTWYHVMKLSHFGGMVPSRSCPTYTYTKPNNTELIRYKEKYLIDGAPYSFDDNPIHEDRGYSSYEGLLMGTKQAKFFIWNPASVLRTPEYDVRVYERINDDYVLMRDCRMRGFLLWVTSRKRNPSAEELDAIIRARDPEIARMQRQRFCALA